MKLCQSFLGLLSVVVSATVYALPAGFVYLDQVDATIVQDLKYATANNFVGRRIHGYESGRCILTKQAADHLHDVQLFLLKSGWSLKVYDCYRPTRAVSQFVSWSKDIHDQIMKPIKYPRIDKKDVFKLGYVALRSGHSRGSTIDLSVVSSRPKSQHRDDKQHSCLKSSQAMKDGNEMEMGSDYDCLDPISNIDSEEVSKSSKQNRLWLKSVMVRHDFVPYDKEWWHFTLANEPYPDHYFNFPVA